MEHLKSKPVFSWTVLLPLFSSPLPLQIHLNFQKTRSSVLFKEGPLPTTLHHKRSFSIEILYKAKEILRSHLILILYTLLHFNLHYIKRHENNFSAPAWGEVFPSYLSDGSHPSSLCMVIVMLPQDHQSDKTAGLCSIASLAAHSTPPAFQELTVTSAFLHKGQASWWCHLSADEQGSGTFWVVTLSHGLQHSCATLGNSSSRPAQLEAFPDGRIRFDQRIKMIYRPRERAPTWRTVFL